MKRFFVYILASERNGTLYTGVTSDLVRRVWQHKEKIQEGFTSRYNVVQLVYYQEFGTAYDAITKEKQIKKWNRSWKMRLIEEQNPKWLDLYETIVQ